MLRKLGLAICYALTAGYILSILLPAVYCMRHGCKGPGDLDAFMPAFALTPVGAITTAISLFHAVRQIKKGQSSWIFWPLAAIFSVILLGVIALVAVVIFRTAIHR